jgi:hypothetical protein
MMIIRIFEGDSWSTAEPVGDCEFDSLPAAGHKLAIAGRDGWMCAQVRDIAHRIGDPGQPADVALLVGPMLQSDDRSEMPLAGLDRLRAPSSPAGVPKAGPWG